MKLAMNPRMFTFSRKEIQLQLLVLAIVTWGFAALNSSTARPESRVGPAAGTDFLHFYVLGNLAGQGRGDLLYDAQAQRAEQVRLVQSSEGLWFVPVYGPQTALLFAAFSALPYVWAAVVWALLTTVLYGACIWAAWHHCASLAASKPVIALAALGFTPFYWLILSGQTSALPLACVTLAYLALRADRKWWAGFALGSLVIKPQFGLAVALVMVARREVRITCGAVMAIAAQWGVSALVLGLGPLRAYFDVLLQGPRLAALLEPKLTHLHSLRSFWTLLVPQPSAAMALYILTSVLALALAVHLWRAPVPLEVRFSALILATILISPHVGLYDLVLLAPAFILTACKGEASTGRRRRVVRVLLYLAYLIPMSGPLATFTHLQLSVPLLGAWLITLHWVAVESSGGPGRVRLTQT